MVKRKIVEIDEDKCDGCGLCVPNCHEGALQIVDGKAKLVSDVYCDGLGNCLGHCPQDAIHVVEKDVADFDFAETNKHLKSMGKEELKENPLEGVEKMEHKNSMSSGSHGTVACGCPGTMVRSFESKGAVADVEIKGASASQESQLRQWPVQLSLVPPNAGFLQGSDLLIAADCVSAAHPNFHGGLLRGKSLVMGCPKLDDISEYKDKIKTMIEINDLNTITVAVMEVPCCAGLYTAVEEALDETGKRITLKRVVVGVDGKQKD